MDFTVTCIPMSITANLAKEARKSQNLVMICPHCVARDSRRNQAATIRGFYFFGVEIVTLQPMNMRLLLWSDGPSNCGRNPNQLKDG